MNNLKERNIGIDVLKALAVISVIIYHLYEYKGTYIGVVIFLVISGYFITSILFEREESYFSFILRRFSKIFPLLTVILAVVCLIFFVFNGFLTHKMLYSSLTAFFGLSNIYQIYSNLSYFERSGDMFPLLHTWTLSIEIQFYIFYPFLIYALKKLKFDNKKNTIILLILSLLSAYIMFYKVENNYDINYLYYGTDTRIFSLFIGGAYYFAFKDKEINKKKMNIFAIIAALIITYSILSINYMSDLNYKGLLYLLSMLTGIMVIATVKGNFLNFNNKVFKVLGGLGKHSYCYYLWQYPIMVFAEEYFKWSNIKYEISVIIQLIILITVSEISYKFLEERVKMAKLLQKIFLFIYVVAIFFLPISDETNAKTIENMINEVNIEMQIREMNKEIESETSETNEIGASDNFEKRLLEESEGKEKIEEVKQLEKVEAVENENLKKDDEKKGKINSSEVIEKEKTEEKTEITETKPTELKEEKIEKKELIDEQKYTFIGDSVMKGAEPRIMEIFINSNVDAKVSRQFVNLPKILEELESNKKLNDIVVVHLGTNGVINKESFEKSMEILKDKKVYFMNTVVPKFWEETINKNLKEWSEGYDNIEIIDWYTKAKGKKELFYKDATHPNKEGIKAYAELIYESVK